MENIVLGRLYAYWSNLGFLGALLAGATYLAYILYQWRQEYQVSLRYEGQSERTPCKSLFS